MLIRTVSPDRAQSGGLRTPSMSPPIPLYPSIVDSSVYSRSMEAGACACAASTASGNASAPTAMNRFMDGSPFGEKNTPILWTACRNQQACRRSRGYAQQNRQRKDEKRELCEGAAVTGDRRLSVE